MNLHKPLQNYIDSISSNSPTPGGGNVSAFCGVLAASLGNMVCTLTAGKKKYLDVESEINSVIPKLNELKTEFLSLAEQDNEAFDRVMDALKLPKESEEQKLFRKTAIDNATLEAAAVPADVINKSKALLPLLRVLAFKGNQNSLSDSGVAISLALTAAQGAYLNVVINCSSLSNHVAAEEFRKRSEIIFDEVKHEANSLIEQIIGKIINKV